MGRNLDSVASASKRARQAVAAPHPGQEREADEADGNRIHVPVAGERPERQRIPGVDQDALPRQSDETQDLQKREDRDALEGEHRGFHARHGCGRLADGREHDLRHRRIDGARVVGAIDPGIDFCVAKTGEGRIGRHVAIGVDAGRLHPPVPHVAVDVGGEERRRLQERQPHECGDAEHDPQRGRGGRGSQDQPDRCEIDNDAKHQKADKESGPGRRRGDWPLSARNRRAP